MQDNGKRQKDLANLLGISITATSNKLNGLSDFYLNEVQFICEQWGVGSEIFLP
jgi:antitoxin component HigA of HigAB toxin-antitoxin module